MNGSQIVLFRGSCVPTHESLETLEHQSSYLVLDCGKWWSGSRKNGDTTVGESGANLCLCAGV